MLTRVEVVAASAVATLATAILGAYLPYRAGLLVHPFVVLAAALPVGIIAGLRLRRRAGSPDGRPAAPDMTTMAAVVIAVLGALVWLARPDMLPLGGGPDLAHHLVLINYIERAWRLVDDPALYPYLGDMMDYTPGSHLLIALAGRWTGTDGLHAAHAVLSATVAIKAGLVFCIARRSVPEDAAATPFAAAAALLIFLPFDYVLGSFVVHSYWAQVVAELFAIAACWTIVVWDDEPRIGPMALFALFGAATFVTWPMWVGPIVLTAAVVVGGRERTPLRVKALHLAIGVAPVALASAIHSIGRLGRLQMAGTSGFAIRPAPAVFGGTFLAVSLAGLVWMTTTRRGRTMLAFVAALLLQSVVLLGVARAGGADTPYMALKMIYLTPYPLAIAGGSAMAAAWSRLPRLRFDRLAWGVAVLCAALVARGMTRAKRPQPIVTESVWQAGRWARDHVDRACVDYLVADGYTGYWLHLAVLDNPRDTPRFLEPGTFEPAKAIARWVESDGLPYAIVDDVRGFSKALFSGTETLADFPPSRVIKRQGAAICDPAH